MANEIQSAKVFADRHGMPHLISCPALVPKQKNYCECNAARSRREFADEVRARDKALIEAACAAACRAVCKSDAAHITTTPVCPDVAIRKALRPLLEREPSK